jgi:hypothetical protein
MSRAFGFALLTVAVIVPPAAAGVHVVASFASDDYAARGAVGLAVPGAGPTVTRESARNTLLTGETRSSIVGGTRRGTSRIELGESGPSDVYVVLPPPGRSENRRYSIALVGGGATGVLTSDSTRIPGLVSLADVATGRLRYVADNDPVGTLDTLETRIERNDRIRLPLTLALVVAAIGVALIRPRWGPRVFLLALAGNLWLAGWWVAALVAAAVALPLGWAAAAVLAATLLVLWRDPAAVALSPFGPSQAGRFYGVSNLLETMLLVPALLGAALLGRLGVVVAAIALVAVAGSDLGADGGGLLVLLAAYATLALRVYPVRLSGARLAAVGMGVVVTGAVFVGLDAAAGASSHVTDAVGGGPGELVGDIGRRLEISARRTLAGAGPAIAVAISLAGLAYVATRRPRGALTDALLVGLAVSLLVNDTPSDVLGVGAAAAFALLRWEQWRQRDAVAPG